MPASDPASSPSPAPAPSAAPVFSAPPAGPPRTPPPCVTSPGPGPDPDGSAPLSLAAQVARLESERDELAYERASLLSMLTGLLSVVTHKRPDRRGPVASPAVERYLRQYWDFAQQTGGPIPVLLVADDMAADSDPGLPPGMVRPVVMRPVRTEIFGRDGRLVRRDEHTHFG